MSRGNWQGANTRGAHQLQPLGNRGQPGPSLRKRKSQNANASAAEYFVHTICNRDPTIKPTEFEQVYIKYLQVRFESILERIRPLLAGLAQDEVVGTNHVFKLSTRIASSCISADSFDIDAGIKAAVKSQPPLLKPEVLTDPALFHEARTIHFFLVGAMLMLYPPALIASDDHLSLVEIETNAIRNTVSAAACEKPLCEMIQEFGPLMPTKPRVLSAGHLVVESPDAYFSRQSLYVSLLNIATLKDLGRLTVIWTDCLSSHLCLDEQNDTIKIFRLPSFCKAFSKTEGSALFKVLDNYYDDYAKPPTFTTRGYLDEVHKSYRLLFGDSSARKAYKKTERSRAQVMTQSEASAAVAIRTPDYLKGLSHLKSNIIQIVYKSTDQSSTKAFVDPELDRLVQMCAGNKRGSFGKETDFPILAERLTILQEYILRQNATSIKMLWTDRRNKLQWSTFWAVVFLGGFGLLLQLGQFAAAIAQVILQAKSG